MVFNKTLYKHIGAKIRDRRIKVPLTLTELGNKLNISHQQMYKYEQGITSVSAPVLYKLSKIFSVDSKYFYEGLNNLEQQYIESLPNTLEPSSSEGRISLKRTKPLDLMIIDYDAKDELMLRHAIDKSGIQTNILSFHNGTEALAFLKNPLTLINFPKPELIFLEISLPKQEGEYFLRGVKRDQNLKDIPVVIITNSISYNQMVDCYKHQVAGFLQKIQVSPSFDEAIQTILTYWNNTMILPHMDFDSKESQPSHKGLFKCKRQQKG